MAAENITSTVDNGVSAIIFATACLAISGLAMFFLADETVSCERSAGLLRCRLIRHVAGIPLRRRDLSGLQAVSIESQDSAAQSGVGRRFGTSGGTSYWIRYHTERGPVDGTAASGSDTHESTLAGLQQLLATRDTSSFEATLRGHWMATRVMPVLFLFGVLIMVNGVVIIVRSRRRGR
jgi:hypothetical protein